MVINKKSVRGYNQSELIAKEIAKETGTVFEKDLLIKIILSLNLIFIF